MNEINGIDKGDILVLAVALSAYLAGIRTFTIERLGSPSITSILEKKLKKLMFWISVADALLIISAVVLIADFLIGGITWLFWIAMVLFCFGIAVLLIMHSKEWCKSFKEYCRLKCGRSRTCGHK
jgi:hypothetical protein